MRLLVIPTVLTCFMLAGCGGKSPQPEPASVEVLLKQGPVSAWRIPFVTPGDVPAMCRYVVTGQEKPRQMPVDGNSLVLTTVDQDGILTIVHSATRGAMSSSLTFKIKHPLPGDIRVEGPHAITVQSEPQTLWKKTWVSPDTREPVFSVEILALSGPSEE